MSKLAVTPAVMAVIIVAASTAQAQDESWTDRISFRGDTRLRFESIDEDGEADRRRMRFRVRVGMNAKINDDVKFVLQLATGGDDPVSTNQSFDDGFSTKDIGVDLAYVEWSPNDDLTVIAGKMKNPLYRAGGAPLIWDGDLNPEGIVAKYTAGAFFATAGGFSVEERSSTDDSLLYAVQVGSSFEIAAGGKLTAGAGYFGYTDTVGNAPFYDRSPNGNSVDVAGNYLFEYRNTELFAQYDTELGGWPFRAFAHATQNNEVSQEDTAFAFGVKLGSAKKQGSSQYSWSYQDLEADSVIGTFSDSDFGGGGTDASGHVLKAKYMLRDKISLGGTLFLNDVDEFQGTEHDYSRLQLDVEFKFN